MPPRSRTSTAPATDPEPQSLSQVLVGRDPRSLDEVVNKNDTREDLYALDAALDRKDRDQDIGLKKFLARFAVWSMVGQLVATHLVFFLYGALRWNIPDGVMIAYLTENFAQVVTVVLVITNYLFPSPRHHKEPPRRSMLRQRQK